MNYCRDMFKKSSIRLVVIFMAVFHSPLFAADANYWGTVTRLSTFGTDGSFLVFMDNSVINTTCAQSRVSFMAQDMGAERTKAALSMAMTALVSGLRFAVTVDLPPQGSVCTASPTANQGANLIK